MSAWRRSQSLLLLALLAGCVQTPEVRVSEQPEETPERVTPVVSAYPSNRPPLKTPPPMPSPFGTPATLSDDRLEAIRADLAGRGVTPTELTVVSVDAVTWNDGSWGCPQPGQGYTQAVVNGFRVVVEVGGDTYDYRFGEGATPRLCVP